LQVTYLRHVLPRRGVEQFGSSSGS